ncbi:protein AMBP-like [Varroa jacobsoni]|uniref:protein AMBP-like n=1 Tax=Varroa jacobsoni TaxID=62625 RepID=UPI000BF5BC8D|nr:protein AMBP-like [Varroa jacobsoni]
MSSYVSVLVLGIVLLLLPTEGRRRQPVRSNCADSFNAEDICEMRPRTGSCRVARIKMYYNHTLNQCRRFIYGGCKHGPGPFNMFDSCRECQFRCADKGTTCVQNRPERCRHTFPTRSTLLDHRSYEYRSERSFSSLRLTHAAKRVRITAHSTGPRKTEEVRCKFLHRSTKNDAMPR